MKFNVGLLIIATVFSITVLAPGAILAQDPDFAGTWGGSITFSGTPVGVSVNLNRDPDGWRGTLDIPSQGVVGLALSDIQTEGNAIQMSIPAPSIPTFKGVLQGDEIAGTFTQHGEVHPFRLKRGEGPGPNRPQTPKPPFPYVSEAVTLENGNVRLSGTLTTPKGDGPFPAVIFVTGSGPQDRNAEIFGHKPFLVIADRLTRAGIATLRWDDRGVGGSSGSLSEATTLDLAADVLAGARFLGGRKNIDPRRIGVIGHSEGAAVAAVAATRSENIAALVLLSGMGVPGREVLLEQAAIVSRASKMPAELIEGQRQKQKQLFEAILADAPRDSIRARTIALMKARIPTPRDTEINARIADELARMESPWFRHFLEYDPREALKKIQVPVLALTGARDMQVSPTMNLAEIEKALQEAGNPDATVQPLPGLNHLFQECLTGKFEEYAGINQTFSPGALDRIEAWLKQRLQTQANAKG